MTSTVGCVSVCVCLGVWRWHKNESRFCFFLWLTSTVFCLQPDAGSPQMSSVIATQQEVLKNLNDLRWVAATGAVVIQTVLVSELRKLAVVFVLQIQNDLWYSRKNKKSMKNPFFKSLNSWLILKTIEWVASQVFVSLIIQLTMKSPAFYTYSLYLKILYHSNVHNNIHMHRHNNDIPDVQYFLYFGPF